MKNELLKPNVKRIITIVVILALTGLMAFKLYINKTAINIKAGETPAEVDFIPVKVAAVELKKKSSVISFTGYFVARKEVLLTAEAQGSLIQLNIKEGQKVRRGQVIARIDPTAIQSNLSTAHASLNKAIKDKERYERLAAAGAISQKQYEDIALTVDNARANLTGIQQQMKYTIIRSPLSGTVSEVKVERGSFATVGSKIGTVVDVSKLKMVIQLPEADVIKIKEGQAVQIRTEIYPDHVFNGNISLIGVQADEGRKYNVEVEMPNNGDYPLKAGMFGSVLLEAQVKDNGEKIVHTT
ncbi:MAG: efflux RND transporter periplasmic adaptor subunit [Bacteroidota bacterium]